MVEQRIVKEANNLWGHYKPRNFREAALRKVRVGEFCILVGVAPVNEFKTDSHIEVDGTSMVVYPRYTLYRDHFVLVPAECLRQPPRWRLTAEDIVALLWWSRTTESLVWLSTFKSGASEPGCLHAQSIPLCRNGRCVSPLRGARSARWYRSARFGQARVGLLKHYLVRGLKLAGDLDEIAELAFNMASRWDQFRAYNLIVIPGSNAAPSLFFVPRRRDGRTNWGKSAWNIAGIEVAGLLQAKTAEEANSLNAKTITRLFAETTADEDEFDLFKRLLAEVA